MTKLVLSSQTICSNDNTFVLSFVEKKPSLIVKISSVCSQDPTDSGCETSTPQSPPPAIKIEEPAIQKRFVQVEESVDDALLEELFKNGPEESVQPFKTPVSELKTHTGLVLCGLCMSWAGICLLPSLFSLGTLISVKRSHPHN